MSVFCEHGNERFGLINFREYLGYRSVVLASQRLSFVSQLILPLTFASPHVRTREQLSEFSRNFILGSFTKNYQHIPVLVNIGQK